MPRRKTTKRKQNRGPNGGFARKAPKVVPTQSDAAVVDDADHADSGQESPTPNNDSPAMDEEVGSGEGAVGGVQDERQTALSIGSAAAGAAAGRPGIRVGLEIAPHLVPSSNPQSGTAGGGSSSNSDNAPEAVVGVPQTAGAAGAATAAASGAGAANTGAAGAGTSAAGSGGAAAAAARDAGAAGVEPAASSGQEAGVPNIAAPTRTSTREGRFSGQFGAPRRSSSGVRPHGGSGRGVRRLLPEEVLSPFAECRAKGGKSRRKIRKAELRERGEMWTPERRRAAILAANQGTNARAGDRVRVPVVPVGVVSSPPEGPVRTGDLQQGDANA